MENVEGKKPFYGRKYTLDSETPVMADEKKQEIKEIIDNHKCNGEEIFIISFRESSNSIPLSTYAVILDYNTSCIHIAAFAVTKPIHYIIPLEIIESIESEKGEIYYLRESITK